MLAITIIRLAINAESKKNKDRPMSLCLEFADNILIFLFAV